MSGSGVSFGIAKPKRGARKSGHGHGHGQPQRPLARQPLAAFAEPSEEPDLDALPAGQRDAEADRLQAEGNEQAEAGQFSAALRLWDRALLYAPQRAALHELKSQAFMQAEHFWEAIRSATQATQLAPAWPEGFLTLARAQLSFGEPEQALEGLERVLSLQPQHTEALEEIVAVRALVLRRQQDPASSGRRLRVE